MFTNVLDRDMALCEVASHEGPESAIALLDNIVSQENGGDPLDAGAAAAILFMTGNYELAQEAALSALIAEEEFVDAYGQSSQMPVLILRALETGAPFSVMLRALRESAPKVMALAEKRYGKGE